MPPCAPTPGRRNTAWGIDSRREVSQWEAVAPTTAPTTASLTVPIPALTSSAPTEPLEAGNLKLDGHALLRRSLQHQRAVGRDRERSASFGGAGSTGRTGRTARTARGTRQLDRARPQACRVGIETQHQLRATFG